MRGDRRGGAGRRKGVTLESGSIASGAPPTRGKDGASAKGLKSGALNLFASVVIGVASVAPGYSLAATLGLLAAAVGLASPFILIVSFIPMILVAGGFYYMNRADSDCGETFIWTSRAFGPHIGWVIGFSAVAASVIVEANLAQIASVYMFEFFGAHGLAASTFWSTFGGVCWIVVDRRHRGRGHRGLGAHAVRPDVPAALPVGALHRLGHHQGGRDPSSGLCFHPFLLVLLDSSHGQSARRRRHPVYLPLLGLGHRHGGQRGEQRLEPPARRVGSTEHAHPGRPLRGGHYCDADVSRRCRVRPPTPTTSLPRWPRT